MLSIEHNQTLHISADAGEGEDVVNGARNQGSRVTLSVLETDVSGESGGAAGLFASLAALRHSRALCTLVTPLAVYNNMLLSEITVREDAEHPYGWAGDLVFTQALSGNAAEDIPETGAETGSGTVSGTRFKTALKTDTQSSVRFHTGSRGLETVLSDAAFRQLLQRAGIGELA